MFWISSIGQSFIAQETHSDEPNKLLNKTMRNIKIILIISVLAVVIFAKYSQGIPDSAFGGLGKNIVLIFGNQMSQMIQSITQMFPYL